MRSTPLPINHKLPGICCRGCNGAALPLRLRAIGAIGRVFLKHGTHRGLLSLRGKTSGKHDYRTPGNEGIDGREPRDAGQDRGVA